MSPAQQKVVDALESGARLEATYGGVYVAHTWKNGRRGRCLHPVTEKAVLRHFGSRLVYVHVRSALHGIPGQFYCLKEHLDTAAGDRKLIAMRELT